MATYIKWFMRTGMIVAFAWLTLIMISNQVEQYQERELQIAQSLQRQEQRHEISMAVLNAAIEGKISEEDLPDTSADDDGPLSLPTSPLAPSQELQLFDLPSGSI